MGVARDLGPRDITANVVEAGLMDSGMQPPDPDTLKALLSSLSLQRMGHPDENRAAIAFPGEPRRVVRHGRGAGRPRRLQRLNPNPCRAPQKDIVSSEAWLCQFSRMSFRADSGSRLAYFSMIDVSEF